MIVEYIFNDLRPNTKLPDIMNYWQEFNEI